MVPIIEPPALSQEKRIDRVEFHNPDAMLLQVIKERSRGVKRTNAVVDQVYLNALILFFREELGEFLSRAVVVENISFHVDVVSGTTNSGQHGAIGRRIILQQAHAVSNDKRTIHFALHEANVLVQNVVSP